jgi:hypothetical protein
MKHCTQLVGKECGSEYCVCENNTTAPPVRWFLQCDISMHTSALLNLLKPSGNFTYHQV